MSYVCDKVTPETEVVQCLQRLLCREFGEFFHLLTLSLATCGSHLYAFKSSFSFLKNLLESNLKNYLEWSMDQ